MEIHEQVITKKTVTQAPISAGFFFLEALAFLLSSPPAHLNRSFLAYFSSHASELSTVFTSHHLFYMPNLRTGLQKDEHPFKCLPSLRNMWLWLCTSFRLHLFVLLLVLGVSFFFFTLNFRVLIQDTGRITSQCNSSLCPFVSPWPRPRARVCWACVRSALWPSVTCSA